LSKRLGEIGMSVVPADGINQTPLFCIIKVGNRDYLRKYLVENKIYCPVHWPLYDELNELNESFKMPKLDQPEIPFDSSVVKLDVPIFSLAQPHEEEISEVIEEDNTTRTIIASENQDTTRN
jgi:hypothetical protein